MSSRKEFVTDKLANAELNDYDRSMFQVELQQIEEQEQEAEQRLQQQEEHMGGLLETIRSLNLYEAIKPQPEDGERLHEYDEQRKEFNLILHDFVAELEQSRNDKHNAEISAKNDEIFQLKQDNEAVKANNTVWENRWNQTHDELQIEKLERGKLEEDNAAKVSQISSLNDQLYKANVANLENHKLRQTIAELEEKLEQAQKPKEMEKPSENIQDRIKKLGSKSADDMLANFASRNPGAIEVPDIDVSQFRNDAEPTGDSIHSEGSETASNIPDAPLNHFRDEAESVDGEPDTVREGADEDGRPVTRAEFEARMTNLEKGMEQLQRKVFGEVAA